MVLMTISGMGKAKLKDAMCVVELIGRRCFRRFFSVGFDGANL